MLTIISHPDCEKHEGLPGHVERPDRVKIIQSALENTQFPTEVTFARAKAANREVLWRVHTPDYVESIYTKAPRAGLVILDEDTQMNPHTLPAALLAAGAVIEAVDLVMTQASQVVFCNVRPPGHHAEPDKAMGFCIFNNVAVGAAHALTQYALKRVAIIDFDVHHGNGTQAIFQHDPRVLLCSTFQHPFYPGYEATADNAHILGVPLPAGTDGKTYRHIFTEKVMPAVDAFQPELIVISAGFDAHQLDEIASLNLLTADYVWLTQQIKQLALKHCQGKIISVLEGGYHLTALKEAVPLHVVALCDKKGPCSI